MKKSPLLVIFFIVFLDLLGLGIMIPVVPILFADPSSSFYLLPPTVSIEQAFILFGFMIAMYPLGQFIAAPILGQLSDRYGRKKVLLFSLLGTFITYLLFAYGILTKNIPLMFASRFIDGMTGGNLSVAQAAIADITPPHKRAQTFGLIGAAFGIGFIMGPFIGGKLSDPSFVSWFGADTPFWFAGLLSLINIISVLTLFDETHQSPDHQKKIYWHQSILNIAKAYTLPRVRGLLATGFFFQGGFTFFTTFFSVFLISKFHFDQGDVGNYFAYIGLWIAFTQVVVVRLAMKRLKESQILTFALFGTSIFLLTYFIPNTAIGLLFAAPLFSIMSGLSQISHLGLLSRSVDADIQGEILGINASVQALSQAIPPILSGYVAASIGAAAPLWVASGIICISGFVFVLFAKKAHNSEHE